MPEGILGMREVGALETATRGCERWVSSAHGMEGERGIRPWM